MTDWDALYKVVAKGNGFVGTTRQDEDAYFKAFADDAEPILPRFDIKAWFGGLLKLQRAT